MKLILLAFESTWVMPMTVKGMLQQWQRQNHSNIRYGMQFQDVYVVHLK